MEKIKEKREKLQNWLKQQRLDYISTGAPMFLNMPDQWYEPYTVCCENGHVSHRTLKSEALGKNVCLACMEDVYLCPNITEDQLALILGLTPTTQ